MCEQNLQYESRFREKYARELRMYGRQNGKASKAVKQTSDGRQCCQSIPSRSS